MIYRTLSHITWSCWCWCWAWSCLHHTDPDVFTYKDAIYTVKWAWELGHTDAVRYNAATQFVHGCLGGHPYQAEDQVQTTTAEHLESGRLCRQSEADPRLGESPP